MSEIACKRKKLRNTYTYMSLEGSRYILACRNTPEIHLLPEIRERFGEIAHLSHTLVSFAFAPLCVLYARSECKKTESQFEDNSLENSRRVAVNNIRCFLVGGESIHKVFLLFSRSAQSPPLPEIPPASPKISAKCGNDTGSITEEGSPLGKISSELCAPRANPAAAEVPQLRPDTCGGLRHLARLIF